MLVHLGSAARGFRLASHFRPSTPSAINESRIHIYIYHFYSSQSIIYHDPYGWMSRVFFVSILAFPFLLSWSNSRYFSFVLIKPSRPPCP